MGLYPYGYLSARNIGQSDAQVFSESLSKVFTLLVLGDAFVNAREV